MKYTTTIIDYRGIWNIEFRNNNLDFLCPQKHFIINYSNIIVKVIYKLDDKIEEATFFYK